MMNHMHYNYFNILLFSHYRHENSVGLHVLNCHENNVNTVVYF